MVDGPTEVEDLDKTDRNKALVTSFFEDVLIGGNFENVSSYISRAQYDQHNPGVGVGDGLDGYARHVKEMAEKGIEARYVKLHRLVGQGSFAATLSHVNIDGDDWAVIDLFRVSDGKIVEHWDIQEKIMPKDQWGNSGKF